MAIPTDITLKTLKGSWTLSYDSYASHPFLSPRSFNRSANNKKPQQGVSWLTRKAIGAATLTLHFTSTVKPHQPESASPTGDDDHEGKVAYLTMRQTLTGGIPGSTEERVMDWLERGRSNHVYGDVLSRSRFVRGVRGDDGGMRPDIQVQSKTEAGDEVVGKIKAFLTGGTPYLPPDFASASGQNGNEKEQKEYPDLYIHDFGRNEKSEWTAEQIWGLEVIDSQAYLTRRVAVVKGDEYELARLVYRFSGL
ncbi:uncharacterized protein BDV17DRAFT_286883 [Aspergillus undulatus]|uniref:uncharacterized protein n=1 Tax=Aspergillus undulatus TaxID=1810928 RepID=UPI003CCD247D